MKNLFYVTFLILSLSAFAQNKFIEVEVHDTISLQPQTFKCNVIVENKDDTAFSFGEEEEEQIDELALEEEKKNRLQVVKKMLEEKKYTVKPFDKSGMGMFEKALNDADGFSIVVNGIANVENLKEMFSGMKDVKIAATVLKYADEQQAEDQLIKKLMDKARYRAGVIGTNSGLKVGKILEVREGQQNANSASGIKDFYSEILKMGALFGQDTGNYTGSISKTFVVKFAAE